MAYMITKPHSSKIVRWTKRYEFIVATKMRTKQIVRCIGS